MTCIKCGAPADKLARIYCSAACQTRLFCEVYVALSGVVPFLRSGELRILDALDGLVWVETRTPRRKDWFYCLKTKAVVSKGAIRTARVDSYGRGAK